MGSKFFGNRMDKQAPNKKGVKQNFKNSITKINKLKLDDLNNLEGELNYLYNLFNVYTNFNNYLDDDNEYKLDDEIIPIIKEIIEIKLLEKKKDINYNIIIFEDKAFSSIKEAQEEAERIKKEKGESAPRRCT